MTQRIHAGGIYLSLVLLVLILRTTPLFAEDDGSMSGEFTTEQKQVEAEREAKRRVARSVLVFDHLENGLDVKATSLFDNSASGFGSPSLMLTAQWNYRFKSETLFGATLSGMPIRHSASLGRDYTTYYGGLNLGQAIFSHDQYRLVVTVSGGGGILFVRLPQQPNMVGTDVQRPNFTFFEPGAYLTFFTYDNIDMGVTASYRFVHLASNVIGVSNADMTSSAYGLTFRSLLH